MPPLSAHPQNRFHPWLVLVHAESDKVTQVTSSGGVSNPQPGANSSTVRPAHAAFAPPGIGDGAEVRTPITTPDRSEVLAVPLTLTEPEVTMHAEVSTASQV